MRKLFLMLGAPGSGKDYWINQHNLSQYTITPDVLRQQFTTPSYSIDEKNQVQKSLSPSADRNVWQTVFSSVHEHLKRGNFAIVNATHLFKGAFGPYNQDRKTYNYKVYVVDTMAQWFKKYNNDPAEVIKALTLNDQRREPIKQVGHRTIEKYVNRYLSRLNSDGSFNLPNGIHYLDASDEQAVQTTIDWQTTDMSKFKRIKVIGDVHGDYDALQKVFADHQKGDAYIFVGDYLDRGTKSPEVFKFVTQILGGNNLFFIKGNHETGWEKYAISDKASGQFSYDSLPKLKAIYDESQLKTIINRFRKNWLDYVKFKFNDQIFFVSHAGIEPFMVELPGETLDEGLFVEGIGPNQDPYTRDIDSVWHQEMPTKMINIHGHRNSFDRFDMGNSFNLTDDDKFRWLVIDQEGIHPHEIDRINTHGFVQDLINNEHIQQHQIENTNGIVANNFDKQAFRHNIWNDMTVKARGLFTREDRIVGRGFNKFFQVDQTPESTLESLVFPVIVAKKWNGTLIITFWDKETHQLRVFSKGGGDKMSQLDRQILEQTGWIEKLNQYYSIPSNQNTTVLFEGIDPINDPHIVLNDHVMAKPLAIISNTQQGHNLAHKAYTNPKSTNAERAQLAKEIHDATYYTTATDIDELKNIIDDFEKMHPTEEGLVFYGQNKMLKYKSKFYLKAKELRGVLERGKTDKPKYYYGAKPWVKYCARHRIKKFSPELALNLYKLEQDGKINE